MAALACLSLIPLSLLAWVVYRSTLGESGVIGGDPLSSVLRLLISPSLERIWMHSLSWPGAPLLLAIQAFGQQQTIYLLINIALVVMLGLLAVYAALRSRPSYAIYSLTVLVMRLMVVYPPLPLMAAARHLTLIFPIFLQLARQLRRPTALMTVLLINALLWILISALYVRNAFVP